MEKSADAFRTISEVADDLKLPQHVLRFWETRFPQVRPLKRGGNRRFYRPDDVELLRAIKILLYGDGFTIKGVQRILKERGPRAVATLVKSSGGRSAVLESYRTPSPADDGADDDGDEMSAMVAETSGVELDEPGSGDLVLPSDLVDGLQTILYEVSECRRVLASARD